VCCYLGDYPPTSLTSIHGPPGSFSTISTRSKRRKAILNRDISLASVLSNDSVDLLEETGRAVGSAIAIGRMSSSSLSVKIIFQNFIIAID